MPLKAADFTGYETVGDAALRLGYSTAWIRRLAQTGRVKGVLSPLGWLIESRSIDAFLASREQSREASVA